MNDLLKRWGLSQLASALPTLLDHARQQQRSYEAFLRLLLETEVSGRQQPALERRVAAARLPRRVRLETFDFSFQPTLSERLVRELASLRFVETATNVILLGPPGVGKTHLASALALRAMEAGHAALCTTLKQFAQTLEGTPARARQSGLQRSIRPHVFIVDEVGYTRLSVDLVEKEPKRADKAYVRVLHLAASTSEADVEAGLTLLLDRSIVPTFEATRALVRSPVSPSVPVLSTPQLDLSIYDRLLEGRCANA